jgi:hypothetical protein
MQEAFGLIAWVVPVWMSLDEWMVFGCDGERGFQKVKG